MEITAAAVAPSGDMKKHIEPSGCSLTLPASMFAFFGWSMVQAASMYLDEMMGWSDSDWGMPVPGVFALLMVMVPEMFPVPQTIGALVVLAWARATLRVPTEAAIRAWSRGTGIGYLACLGAMITCSVQMWIHFEFSNFGSLFLLHVGLLLMLMALCAIAHARRHRVAWICSAFLVLMPLANLMLILARTPSYWEFLLFNPYSPVQSTFLMHTPSPHQSAYLAIWPALMVWLQIPFHLCAAYIARKHYGLEVAKST